MRFLILMFLITLCFAKSKKEVLVAYTDITNSDGLALAITNRYVKDPGVQYERNNLQKVLGTVEHCMAECDLQQGCVGFEHSLSLLTSLIGHCQLKAHLVGGKKKKKIDTYKLTIFAVPQLGGEAYAIDYLTDYPKNDIEFHNVPYDECADLCTLNPLCVAYVLDMLDSRGCWLKSELVNQAVAMNGHRMTYKKVVVNRVEEKSTVIVSRTYAGDPGHSYVGNIIKKTRGNDCLVECDTTSGCIAVTIDIQGTCYLKNKALNRTPSFVHMSYVLLA